MNGLLSNFSVSGLIAGLIFSTIGLWMLREGKKRADLRIVMLGLVLMIYSYFTPNHWWDWGIGIALCLLAREIW